MAADGACLGRLALTSMCVGARTLNPLALTVSGGVQDGFGGGTNVTNNLIYNQCRESGGEQHRLRTVLLAGLRIHADDALRCCRPCGGPPVS